MTEDAKINLEVKQHADMLDYARVEENSNQKSYSNFWSSYKGHVRGLLAGVLIGALGGCAIGIGIGFLGFTGLAMPVVVQLFSAMGALFGAEAVGSIGASSASRAAGLAEKHARFLDPENSDDKLKAAEDKLMVDGRGHHNAQPPNHDNGNFFNIKSGSAGLLIGAAAGALLGAAHLLAEIPIVSAIVPSLVIFGASAPIAAGALVLGICGLTFGVDRSIFKSIFNQISAFMEGRDAARGDDIGQKQAVGKTAAELLEQRLTRQEDIHYLQKDYDEKIFLSGVDGYLKGAAGGSAIGAIFGAISGAIVVGALMLAVTLAPTVILSIIGGFAAAGTLLGLKTFAETGKEAATESTARAIDDEFERGKELRAKGIYNQSDLSEKSKNTELKPEVIFAMGGVGALIGAALIPVIGVAAPLVFGLIGAATGLGNGMLKGIVNISNSIYNKTYYGHDDEKAPEIKPPTRTVAENQYKITKEEADNLNSKLSENKEKEFGDMILGQQTKENQLSTSNYVR
ncbi:MAG: hypothetical protein WCJ33_01105 [Pseudomonadota bacterium]